jgi:hypothetical protein
MSVEFGKTGIYNTLAFGASLLITCKGYVVDAILVRVAGVIYGTRKSVFFAAVFMMIRWNGVTLSQGGRAHGKTGGMCVSIESSRVVGCSRSTDDDLTASCRDVFGTGSQRPGEIGVFP